MAPKEKTKDGASKKDGTKKKKKEKEPPPKPKTKAELKAEAKAAEEALIAAEAETKRLAEEKEAARLEEIAAKEATEEQVRLAEVAAAEEAERKVAEAARLEAEEAPRRAEALRLKEIEATKKAAVTALKAAKASPVDLVETEYQLLIDACIKLGSAELGADSAAEIKRAQERIVTAKEMRVMLKEVADALQTSAKPLALQVKQAELKAVISSQVGVVEKLLKREKAMQLATVLMTIAKPSDVPVEALQEAVTTLEETGYVPPACRRTHATGRTMAQLGSCFLRGPGGWGGMGWGEMSCGELWWCA